MLPLTCSVGRPVQEVDDPDDVVGHATHSQGQQCTPAPQKKVAGETQEELRRLRSQGKLRTMGASRARRTPLAGAKRRFDDASELSKLEDGVCYGQTAVGVWTCGGDCWPRCS